MADHTCILISPWEPSSQLEVQTSDAKRESNNLLFEKEVLDKKVGKGSKYFQLNCLKVQKISTLRGQVREAPLGKNKQKKADIVQTQFINLAQIYQALKKYV